jgi:hypothetical protein
MDSVVLRELRQPSISETQSCNVLHYGSVRRQAELYRSGKDTGERDTGSIYELVHLHLEWKEEG